MAYYNRQLYCRKIKSKKKLKLSNVHKICKKKTSKMIGDTILFSNKINQQTIKALISAQHLVIFVFQLCKAVFKIYVRKLFPAIQQRKFKIQFKRFIVFDLMRHLILIYVLFFISNVIFFNCYGDFDKVINFKGI